MSYSDLVLRVANFLGADATPRLDTSEVLIDGSTISIDVEDGELAVVCWEEDEDERAGAIYDALKGAGFPMVEYADPDSPEVVEMALAVAEVLGGELVEGGKVVMAEDGERVVH
ncbi:hypothetical protein [Vibrio sp. WXL210]|uniref:hypothetical protein n=1 Tax=Vibrio sp. WXL210 TaxID=3450709 RepID=UPI003EC839FB